MSLEMPYHEIGTRAFAHLCEVNGTAFALADPGVTQRVRSQLAHLDINLPIWCDDQTYSLGGIVSRITEWRRKYGIHFAVVDHIGLVETRGYNSRNEELGAVTRELKKLTKRLGIPVVAVSQLNRDVERHKRLPMLADLRDSGNIEQDADVVLMLHAAESDELRQEVPVELGLLKNRGGKKGWLKERFLFDSAQQHFREQISMGAVA
jgi:replicative DNA helicase